MNRSRPVALLLVLLLGGCLAQPPVVDDDDVASDDDDATADDDDATPDPLDVDDDNDGYTENDGDCDDEDPNNFPGNAEVCDGQDNDCDPGTVDTVDEDMDGVFCDVDCDDGDPNNFPGNIEVCDGQDNDCDPSTVDLVDADADGAFCDVDCDDYDPANFPGNSEVCDGKDNDCINGPDLPGEVEDNDFDAVLACLDCDDSNPSSTTLENDADCDGTIDCLATSTFLGVSFAKICGGSFDMGCTPGMGSACDNEEYPIRTVTLSNDIWVGVTEVTQSQWQSLLGVNPSSAAACGVSCPVENVTWYEALALANAASVAEGFPECYQLAGCQTPPGGGMDCQGVSTNNSVNGTIYGCSGYRLPTEAEWEYMARAGTDFQFSGTNDLPPPSGTGLDDVAWWSGNSGGSPHPVGTRVPNQWGLQDMSGNVAEWTWDWLGGYANAPSFDPEGPNTGAECCRVFRGGYWDGAPVYARVSDRVGKVPYDRSDGIGLRLVRTIP